MTGFRQLFKPELVFLDTDFSGQQAFYQYIASKLQQMGYVKETFESAIIEREMAYPTGLRIAPYPVAIPHTDPMHIVTPFIAVVRCKQPVPFVEMGGDQMLPVQIMFVLGMTRFESQTELLEKLIALFMNETIMNELMKETDGKKMIQLVQHHLDK